MKQEPVLTSENGITVKLYFLKNATLVMSNRTISLFKQAFWAVKSEKLLK